MKIEDPTNVASIAESILRSLLNIDEMWFDRRNKKLLSSVLKQIRKMYFYDTNVKGTLEAIAAGSPISIEEMYSVYEPFNDFQPEFLEISEALAGATYEFNRDLSIEIRNQLGSLPGAKGAIRSNIQILFDKVFETEIEDQDRMTAKDILSDIEALNKALLEVESRIISSS